MKNNNKIILQSSIVPIVLYSNAGLQKKLIKQENKAKAGIYRWVNLINGKTYIGSGLNLSNRLSHYFSAKFMETYLKTGKSAIYSALIKHGCYNFSLEILEYCSVENLIQREQYFIDTLNPDYNICKIAGSMLGFRDTEESKAKTIYKSIREAARTLSIRQCIIKYFSNNQKKPYKGRFVFEKGEGNGKYIITAKSSSHIISMYAQKKTSNSKNLKQNTDLAFGSSALRSKKVDDNPTLLSKHFPVATSEWHNSVYTYNPKSTISLLVIDQMIIKIIKSYLNSFYLEDQNKNHFPLAFAPQAAGQGVREKIHSLYMNKVYVAKPEVKHTNSKVVITIYIYCTGFKNLDILYKHLEDDTKISLAGILSKLYNQKVVFRVIQLRYLQLNSSILAQHLADALAKGGRSPLGLLRRVFRNVRIPKINPHSLDKS